MAASQAEAGYFEESSAAASSARTRRDTGHDVSRQGLTDFQVDLPAEEAPVLEFDSFDWSAAACLSEAAEPTRTEALPPLLPQNISLDLAHSASRISQPPTALQHTYGAPSPAAPPEDTQSVQQSSFAGLSTTGPHVGPSHELIASGWPHDDRLSQHAPPADSGPTPVPRDDATLEWQPASDLQESSLLGQSHKPPAVWLGRRTATGWPSHQVPAATHHCPRNPKSRIDRMPLPNMSAESSQQAGDLPAMSGLLPPEIEEQLEVGRALLQKGQQQLPMAGVTPPASRLLETAAAANSAVMTPSSQLPKNRLLMPSAPPAPCAAPAPRLSTRHPGRNALNNRLLLPPAQPMPSRAPASRLSAQAPGLKHNASSRPPWLLEEPQQDMQPGVLGNSRQGTSQLQPEAPRPHKRSRSRHPDARALTVHVHQMVPHQELAMAGAVEGLRHAAACAPRSLEAQHPPLLRIALAHGRQMSEVLELKQRNLQALQLHPDWHTHYDLSGNSLLDVYAAFKSSNMSFRLPLFANGKQQFVALSTIMRLDMPSLYVQSIAGLASFAFENQACQDPDSLAGRLFTKGACQSLAMGVCMLEAPHHSEKLCDEYQMKDSSMVQGQVTGVDIMHRLNQQLGGMSGFSIALAQRRKAQAILIEHEAFTGRLEEMRSAVLQEMRSAIDIEAQAQEEQLLPSRIVKLSEHAHTLSVLLGLAHESHLAASRKLFLEVLSPWQFGLIAAGLFPMFADMMYLIKFVAGDEPTSKLAPLSDGTVLPRFNKIQMQQQEE